jgi:hypothetical protein
MNLMIPCSNLYFTMAYISVQIKNRLTKADIARNVILNHSRGTTCRTVVIVNIVKE